MQQMLTSCRGAGIRRILAAVISIGALFIGALGSPSPAHADSCAAGTNNPFGGCLLKGANYPGELPYAVTVAVLEQRVIVADLYSGLFYKFDQTNISGTAPTVFVHSLGPATYTGVAWHPTQNTLYWLVDVGTGPKLVRTSTAGIEDLVAFPRLDLTVPNGGLLSGLTWNPETSTLWAVDIVHDIYYSIALDGTIGNSFPSPVLPPSSPIGGQTYGLGLTAIPDAFQPNQHWLDVAVGLPSDLRASRVTRVKSDGTPHGLYYPLDTKNEATGWITGIAWAPTGSIAGPVTFLADLTENRLLEVPTPAINAQSLLDLTCTATPADDVLFSWDSQNQSYQSITVFRDGVVIDSIPGASMNYTDSGLSGGTYSYGFKPVPSSGSAILPTARCDVVVGFGRRLNVVSHNSGMSDPYAITVIETTDQVLVADLQGGTAHLYGKDLVSTGSTIPSPFATGKTTGVAWNSDTNTLLWHNGETGQIQSTELDGTPIGLAATLSPLPVGFTGDICYSAASDTYYGVDITLRRYFEFQADGTVLSNCAFPGVDGGQGRHGQGVAVVNDPSAVILDVPIGPSEPGLADRVVRLLDCSDSGLQYDLVPTTLSGVVAGIAWTPTGSNGLVSEYIVGFDTRAIYEVTLDTSSLGADFQRGDVNNDGIRDISDPTSLLLFLFPPNTAPVNCFDSADANDDGAVNVADVIFVLQYLFLGGVVLPDPITCGPDLTIDSLICNSYPTCP